VYAGRRLRCFVVSIQAAGATAVMEAIEEEDTCELEPSLRCRNERLHGQERNENKLGGIWGRMLDAG
jgi:hypothetical protein